MEISLSQKLWFLLIRYFSWVLPKQSAFWAEDLFLTPTRVPRPESEKSWFESAKKFTLSGGIAAFEWGSSTGPLVVLIHGWSGRGTQMGAFAEPLIQKGYRVVALDGPAHGGSEGERTNVGDYAKFLIHAQKELGPFKAIIAHSFGAGCSVLAASNGLQVEKLVLVAGPSRYEVVVGEYLKFISISPTAQKYFLQSLAQKVGMTAKELNVGNIGNKLQIPALIVHDKDDREVGYAAALEMKEAWPHAHLLTTSSLGHRRILKDAKVIQQVAEFIEKDILVQPLAGT
ncbi:alpha/beta fold hydrolase [Bdellovibrio bacteriovorus]|uniref:alpha/beta fold hydrolase n=1 Tax=Bdellovibrio bacteriovorus TaxID=959 RepID=UPI0035A87731